MYHEIAIDARIHNEKEKVKLIGEKEKLVIANVKSNSERPNGILVEIEMVSEVRSEKTRPDQPSKTEK